jgi:hypothetical protein
LITDDAISTALETLQTLHSTTATYTQGDNTLAGVVVVPGRTITEEQTNEGALFKNRITDYLISVESLKVGETYLTPCRGDKIALADGTNWSVLPVNQETSYRYSDPAKTVYRIHTKQIG